LETFYPQLRAPSLPRVARTAAAAAAAAAATLVSPFHASLRHFGQKHRHHRHIVPSSPFVSFIFCEDSVSFSPGTLVTPFRVKFRPSALCGRSTLAESGGAGQFRNVSKANFGFEEAATFLSNYE
jgi:hypothetical protein